MGKDIGRFRFLEKLLIIYFKNRGDFARIKEELNWPDNEDDRLRWNIRRIRETEGFKQANAGTYLSSLACADANYLRERLMDTRKRISDQVKIVVSMCCSMPVEYVREGDEDLYYCVKCDHETKIRVLLKEEIMQLELEITRLEIKVAEDLQDFIVGLRGSSKGIDDVKVNHTHTHTTKIIVEAVKEKATIDKAVVDLDPEIATKFEILDGQGRSDVIDNISKAIIAGKKKEKVLEEKVAEEKRKKEEGPVA